MDGFSVIEDSFEDCLKKLSLVLERCIECNLTLSLEKSTFMVREGIVLGHIVKNSYNHIVGTKKNIPIGS